MNMINEPETAEVTPLQTAPQIPSKPTRTASKMLKEFIKTLLLVIIVYFGIRTAIQNFKIDGQSMAPTLHPGQYLVVNKLIYLRIDLNAPARLLPQNRALPKKISYPFHAPKRGEVIIFYSPTIGQDLVKRVIGQPGDHIVIRNRKVYVNNQELNEPYINTPTECYNQTFCNTIVPADHIFVLGDNRTNSSDSRIWGPLPLEHVIGKAWISYWPTEYMGIIPVPDYTQSP